jgi:uncharacterized protein (TIGR02594 family)
MMTTLTSVEPVWLAHARHDAGLREIPGPQSAARILAMAHAIGAPSWFHDDDQPWCAVAANAWLLEAGYPMALGERGDQFDRLRARTFESYGQGLSAPALGAITVFSRPEGGHVGFYLGECGHLIRVFGGNQSNKVGEIWMERARLRAYRWPPRQPLPKLRPIVLDPTGEPLSRNEA